MTRPAPETLLKLATFVGVTAAGSLSCRHVANGGLDKTTSRPIKQRPAAKPIPRMPPRARTSCPSCRSPGTNHGRDA